MVGERGVSEANRILPVIHFACLRGRTRIYLHNLLLTRIFRGNTRRQVVGYSDITIFSPMITVVVTTSNNYNYTSLMTIPVTLTLWLS